MVHSARLHIVLFRLWAIIITTCALHGCAESQMSLRAFIVGDTADWRMVEKGGYEGGSPKVDFLTGKDITIRVECLNDRRTKNYFVVQTSFPPSDVRINYTPSSVTVKAGYSDYLSPRVFTCSDTIWDLTNFRTAPALHGEVPMPIGRTSCYLLFIDHPIIAIDENIIMNMNDALSIDGKHIKVPQIVFKKNPKLTNMNQIKADFR